MPGRRIRAGAGGRLGRPAPAAPGRPRSSRSAPRREPFYRVVQAGFRQRRKQLHNAPGPRAAGSREPRARGAFAALRRRRASGGRRRSRSRSGPACCSRRSGAAAVTPFRLEAPAKLNLSLAGRRASRRRLPPARQRAGPAGAGRSAAPAARAQRACGWTATPRRGVPLDAREPRLARPAGRARPGAGPRLPDPREADSGRRGARRRIVGRGRGLAARPARPRARPRPPTRRSSTSCRTIGADVPFFAAQVRSGAGRRHRRARRARRRRRLPPRRAPGPPALRALARPTSSRSCDRTSGRTAGAQRPPGGRPTPAAGARRALARSMVAAGGAPRLTGSGPTLFSLADDPERAAAIAGSLERAGAARHRDPDALGRSGSHRGHRRRGGMTTACERHDRAPMRAPAAAGRTARRSGPASSSSRPGSSAPIRPPASSPTAMAGPGGPRRSRNLRRVLEAAGSGLDRVVKIDRLPGRHGRLRRRSTRPMRAHVPQPYPARSAFAVRDAAEGRAWSRSRRSRPSRRLTLRNGRRYHRATCRPS